MAGEQAEQERLGQVALLQEDSTGGVFMSKVADAVADPPKQLLRVRRRLAQEYVNCE